MTQVRPHTMHTKTGKIVTRRGHNRRGRKLDSLGLPRKRSLGQVLEQGARKRWKGRQRARKGAPWWSGILGG